MPVLVERANGDDEDHDPFPLDAIDESTDGTKARLTEPVVDSQTGSGRAPNGTSSRRSPPSRDKRAAGCRRRSASQPVRTMIRTNTGARRASGCLRCPRYPAAAAHEIVGASLITCPGSAGLLDGNSSTCEGAYDGGDIDPGSNRG